MKQITKSLLAVVLSLMLLAMLPITSLAEVEPIQATLSYNGEYFVNKGGRGPIAGRPALSYDSLKMPDGNIITIEGINATYSFSFDASVLPIRNNDVLNIKDSAQTVQLAGKALKYIGIIANADSATDGGTVDITITFTNNSTITFEAVAVHSMLAHGDHYYEYGETIKTPSSNSAPYSTEDAVAYINLIELTVDTINEVESIEFPDASFDYHVMGIVQIPYTEAELDELENEAINALRPVYVAKSLTDITPETEAIDMENLRLLTVALAGNETYAADYEHISNLYEGYPLYKAQNALKAEYDAIMDTTNYLEATKEYMYANQDEADNLDALTEIYDNQTELDENKAKLLSIMNFFEMTADEQNIFVDASEKATITALKEDYLLYKQQKEIEAKIDELYPLYDGKSTADLSPDDLAKIDELIAAYDEADEIGVLYDSADRAFIENLKDAYAKYQVSENNYHYDLSELYNTPFVAEEGDSLPSDWGAPDNTMVDLDNDVDGTKETTVRTGYNKSVWTAPQDENGIVEAKTHINYTDSAGPHSPVLEYIENQTDPILTFKLSQNTDATDKNIIVLPTSDNPIILKGSGRLAKTFNILSVGGANMGRKQIELNIKYTDGTTQNQKINVVWSGYTQQAVVNLTDSSKLYSHNGIAARTNSTTATSTQYRTRAFSVPLAEGKIIDTVELFSSNSAPVLAVSEQVVSNADFKEIIIAQYNVVKNYNEETFDAKEATTFVLYCNEADNRGIDISTYKDDGDNFIFDMALVESIERRVLTAENKFEKEDKDTVVSTILFSQPVDEDDLKANLKILKGTAETQDYTLTMTDDKTAVIKIPDEPLGGVNYTVHIANTLPLKEYTTYKISKAYEFSYTSPAYIEAALNGTTLTVKNNTLTDYDYVAVVSEISEDNTAVNCNTAISTTVEKSDINEHTDLTILNTSNLLVSLWDENQKLILNVKGGAVATTSPTNESADYMYPTLDIETNELTIAGITPSQKAGKNITLEIKKGTSSFMFKEALTNKDGYFEIVVPLNEVLISTGSMLDFNLGGDDFENAVSLNPVYFAVNSQKSAAINSIIDATSWEDIQTLLNSENIKDNNILALEPLVYKAEGYSFEDAAKTIYAYKELPETEVEASKQFSTDDINGSIKILRQLLVLSAFNQGLEDVVAKDGYLLYNNLMGYSSIDTDGVTIYNLYNTAVSAKGREEFVASITAPETKYTKMDDLISAIAEEMFIIEIEYPLNSAVGYVSNVLTAKNNSKVSLSIPNYFKFLDKSGINGAIARATISDNADIERVVNDYYDIYYVEDTTSGGGFSSGSSSVSSFAADKTALVFNDVAMNHWAYPYISELYEKNILSGKGNGNFAPEDGLTRAELVKIIVTAKGLTADNANLPFTDVQADSWYLPYVKAAYANNIINGVTDTSFAPNEKVSRQDLCVVLYRLLGDRNAEDVRFADGETIAPYAVDAVNCFVDLGIINGFEDGTFRATDGCTRAQCAKIISMFLQQ